MVYLRLCLDGPDTRDLRMSHRAERQRWLEAPPEKIIEAGPLFDESGEAYAGTFMLVEAESREDVVRLHKDDPFTRAGVYERWFVMRYEKRVG